MTKQDHIEFYNAIKVYGFTPSGSGVFVTKDLKVIIVYKSGTLTQYPIQYENGQIAYDFPFQISDAIKRNVEKAYRFINRVK